MKQRLMAQLKQVKTRVLDSLVRETSEFLTYYNEAASLLHFCNWTCLDECSQRPVNATSNVLYIESSVAFLDTCGCSLSMYNSLETLPISNSSLQKVVATLNGNLNLTASDLAHQL